MMSSAVAFQTKGFGSLFQGPVQDRDGLGEVVDGGEHSAAQALAGQFLEPALVG